MNHLLIIQTLKKVKDDEDRKNKNVYKYIIENIFQLEFTPEIQGIIKNYFGDNPRFVSPVFDVLAALLHYAKLQIL